MNVEKHKERLVESIEVIDECITKDIVKRQRTIGFSVSAASADMIEIFLHKNKLVDPEFIVKHEWFKSKNKLAEKFPFEFEDKKSIMDLIYFIEEKRNMLCYGSPQPKEEVRQVIEKFNALKDIFRKNEIE